MNEVNLPELPERTAVLPEMVLPSVHGLGGGTVVFRSADAFTADQMREYARLAVLQERERCAKACERMRAVSAVSYETGEACAAAIRAGHSVTETKRD